MSEKRRVSSRIRQAQEMKAEVAPIEHEIEQPDTKRRKASRISTPVKIENPSHNHKKEVQRALTTEEKLTKLALQYSLLTQELFHLREFTSLVTWDPSKPPTNRYESFVDQNKYSLFTQETAVGKRSTRIKAITDPLQIKITELQDNFKDEIFQPWNATTHSNLRTVPASPIKTAPTKKASSSSAKKIRQTKDKKPVVVKVEANEHSIHNGDHGIYGGVSPDSEEEEAEEEEGEEEGGDLSKSSSPEPEPFFKNGKVPKLKLKLSLPGPVITNPDNLPIKQFNGSVQEYLKSFKLLEEDVTIDQYNKYIDDTKTVFSKLKTLIDENYLTINDDFTINKVVPELPFRDPLKNQHTFNDHLLAQGMHLSKLFKDSRKLRISRCRKIAQMVENHFRREAGAADRARKEEERRLRTLARNAITMVKKRWLLAEKAYKILKDQENEELKRIKGKEHLSQMLEHSNQLLEAQMNKQSDDDMSELSDEDMDDSMKNDDEDDANLTVDQLREKYSHLKDMELEKNDSDDESDDGGEETAEVETPEVETTEVGEDIELTEQEKSALEAEKIENSLLDSESDDSLDSDEESSEEESSEDEGSFSNGGGLASLFGSKMSAEEESDDESVKSFVDEEDMEKADSPKETFTPSSTPDIESRKSRASSLAPTEGTPNGTEGVVDVINPTQLLRGQLRTYQKQGLNWLASLYNNNTNGILADEMGLGKTIQTISLICYLAIAKNNWGPHLIVVPTSVLLNWEMEFKRFAPGFKVLVYYGSPQQRKDKRKGWNTPNTFHVCITSYQLVCQDEKIFKRKKWKYMILDEAHNIKNFKSHRWNALLNFNTENRLLLTGTPLQNNIMELWSLLYFLMPSSKGNQSMPSGFANLDDFQQWFGKPVDKIVENGEQAKVDEETRKTVGKLHQVLRPYLLRRLKADVEAQMPGKYEHIVYCKLSKRQYKLYHEYLARSDTQNMLKNANYISIINCLMQLRKVCNHPDLFEERPITTSLAIQNAIPTNYVDTNNLILKLLKIGDQDRKVNLFELNLVFTKFCNVLNVIESQVINKLKSNDQLIKEANSLTQHLENSIENNFLDILDFYKYDSYQKKKKELEKLKHLLYLNTLRCDREPILSKNLVDKLSIIKPISIDINEGDNDFIKPLKTRILYMKEDIEKFGFVTPAVVNLNLPKLTVSNELNQELTSNDSKIDNPFHQVQTKLSIQFPDKSLLLYDCGKLQKLAKLLQELKDGGHRALIFTQMTKVLDILEQFLNILGIRYMRLDGATKIEDRQILTERFNSDPRITVFILSTRSGGLGINLTGADTVIFYDSDWNPAMDKQCQDRCHRIGQTRDVHIYRFVSEYTIESNILKKANQKRHLDNVVIQEGEFTTDYFSRLSVNDLLGDEAESGTEEDTPLFGDTSKLNNALLQAEDAQDAQAARAAMREVALDEEDFNEDGKEGEEDNSNELNNDDDEHEGTGHIDEYMIRYIANGYYYD